MIPRFCCLLYIVLLYIPHKNDLTRPKCVPWQQFLNILIHCRSWSAMCVKQEGRLKLSELLELEEMFNNIFEESPISILKLNIIIISFRFSIFWIKLNSLPKLQLKVFQLNSPTLAKTYTQPHIKLNTVELIYKEEQQSLSLLAVLKIV